MEQSADRGEVMSNLSELLLADRSPEELRLAQFAAFKKMEEAKWLLQILAAQNKGNKTQEQRFEMDIAYRKAEDDAWEAHKEYERILKE